MPIRRNQGKFAKTWSSSAGEVDTFLPTKNLEVVVLNLVKGDIRVLVTLRIGTSSIAFATFSTTTMSTITVSGDLGGVRVALVTVSLPFETVQTQTTPPRVGDVEVDPA